MNRHYDRETYLQKVNYAKKVMPDLVLTSDVIVGFPGETDEEFEETISLIQSVHYDSLFTFIFSPRPGTPAAEMDDPTPKEAKNRRFDRLCACRTPFPRKSTIPTSAKPSAVLWTAKTKTFSPPAPRADAWCASPAGRHGRHLSGHHHHRRHHMEPERKNGGYLLNFCTNIEQDGINIWHRQRMN